MSGPGKTLPPPPPPPGPQSGKRVLPPPPPPPPPPSKPSTTTTTTAPTTTTTTFTLDQQRRAEITRLKNALRLNPLRILKLSPKFTLDEVKQSYKTISLLVHPDKCPVELVEDARGVFAVLNTAREFLLDDTQRAEFLKLVDKCSKKVLTQRLQEIRTKLEAQGKPLSSVTEDDVRKASDFPEAVLVSIDDEVITKEWEKKQSLREQANIGMEEYQERVVKKKEEELKRKAEELWETTRDERVHDWRSFSKNKKFQVYKPPSAKIQENLNRHSLKRKQIDFAD